MNQNICYNCGGEFVERGRKYVCPYCGTVKPQDVSNEEISLLYTAYQKLRLADFYEAEQEFDDIIRRYPKNAQGYWGRLLARYGIKYEDDYDGTKIPSCYLTSIESVFEASDYKKALKYADSDNRSVYKKHADYIEHVRQEWIEKASSEEPYDIFISYKDSDRENGIERTEDSYAMQEMYFRLKEKGYRVFFSRESLRGISGKEYEPYIFNALSTSKIMIVYASNPEYINATWVKNEWTRYLGRIRSGDKKQGSLLVVYEGFAPKELPMVLARLQCLDASDKFFYPDLLSSIAKLLEEDTEQNALDAIELNVSKQEESQGLEYKVNSDGRTCEITSRGSCKDETIVIPQKIENYTVVGIGEGAFRENLDIISVTIPNTVRTIGDSAFYQCTGLSNVMIPKSVTSIGGWAFFECGEIESLTLPASVKNIGKRAFKGVGEIHVAAGNFHYVSINGNLYSKNKKILIHYAANKTESSFTIPSSVTTIDESAFSECANLVSVEIPNTVTDIGEYAFFKCGCLERVTIPFGVKTIEQCTFSECSNLKNVTLPNSIISIGKWAFDKTALETINIPRGVVSIDNSAFHSCTKLTSVMLPDSVKSIGGWTFYGCTNLASLMLPPFIESIGQRAFSTAGEVHISDDNSCYVSIDGNLYSKDMKTLIHYAANKRESSFKVPVGVAVIGDSSFDRCKNLTEVLIPDTVTDIGDYAFDNCSSLNNLTIPVSVKTIGKSAFGSCKDLKDFRYAGTQEQWSRINLQENWNKSSGIEDIQYNESDLDGIQQKASEGLAYKIIDSKTCEIKGLGSCEDEHIVIPRKIGNYTVTAIGKDAFRECAGIMNVTIPNTVKSIGESAFHSCTNLLNVTIPKSVTSIGGWAFFACAGIRSLTIPLSVSSIGKRAFRGIGETNVSADNRYYISVAGNLYSKDMRTLMHYAANKTESSFVIPPSVTAIADSAFSACRSLISVLIPNTVTDIGEYAFYGCEKLESITIPDGITIIGESMFSGCAKLSSARIPSSVTSIGNFAFKGTALETVNIPQGVASIGNSVFSDCAKLSSVSIPSSVTSIGNFAFKGTALETVNIPQGVASIGESAFSRCEKLKSVMLPDSVKNIGGWAFHRCTSLASLMLPPFVESIGQRAFYGIGEIHVSDSNPYYISDDGNLYSGDLKTLIHYAANKTDDEFEIPSFVTNVADSAFAECYRLVSVSIPNTVSEILDFTFNNCSGLESVNIPVSVKTIGKSAFESCKNLKDFRYAGTQEQWSRIDLQENWNKKSGIQNVQYNAVGVGDSLSTQPPVQVFEREEQSKGFVYTIKEDKTCEITGLGSCDDENLIIPQKIEEYAVTSIGEMAFFNCTHLVSVYIPDSVIKIGAQAFYNCTRLESVNIPVNVTNIDFQTFYNCISLKKADVSASVTNVGMQAFYNCINLVDVDVSHFVTNVGVQAFYNCISLKKNDVLNSSVNVGLQAFHD